MKNLYIKLSSIVVVLLICVSFTGTDVSAQQEKQKPQFELLHLWLVDIEKHALKIFSFEAKKRGVEWYEQEVSSNFDGIRAEFAERFSLGNPPSASFWIGGRELKKLVNDGTFRVIESTESSPDFSDILLPEIYNMLEYENGITALPMGIHLQNHIAYNSEIYADLKLEIPRTWHDFVVSAKQIKQAGYDALTISDQRWQLRFLYVSILAEFLSADEFRQLIQTSQNLEKIKPALIKALEILDALRPYVNENHNNLAWDDAVNRLVTTKAAASVLGDFSSPLYANDNKFICGLPPGNDYILWSFDTVVLTNTNDPSQLMGQDIFIDIATGPRRVAEYIYRKGGIPAYKNIASELVNECSKKSIKNWKEKPEHIHLNSENWRNSLNAIASVVQNFWLNPNTSISKVADDIITSLNSIKS